jgi:hypothetical protein
MFNLIPQQVSKNNYTVLDIDRAENITNLHECWYPHKFTAGRWTDMGSCGMKGPNTCQQLVEKDNKLQCPYTKCTDHSD